MACPTPPALPPPPATPPAPPPPPLPPPAAPALHSPYTEATSPSRLHEALQFAASLLSVGYWSVIGRAAAATNDSDAFSLYPTEPLSAHYLFSPKQPVISQSASPTLRKHPFVVEIDFPLPPQVIGARLHSVIVLQFPPIIASTRAATNE